MAIKMRVFKKDEAICKSCQCTKNQCVDMFEVMIGDERMFICDACMQLLFKKSLNAICYVNGRVKQPRDTQIINARNIRRKMAKEKDDQNGQY